MDKALNWLAKAAGGALGLAVIATLVVLGGRAGWYGGSKVVVEPLSAARPAAVIFFLPRAMVGLELSYAITKCDVARPAGSPEAVTLTVDIGARLAESTEPDLARGYAIRADSVSGAFWRTDVTIETQNSVLKSVNAAASSEYALPKEVHLEPALAQIVRTLAAAAPSSDATPTEAQRRAAICGDPLVQYLGKPAAERKPEDNPASMKRLLRFDPAGACPADTTPGAQSPETPGLLVCVLPGAATVGALLATREAVQLGPFAVQIRLARSPQSQAAPPAPTVDIVYRTAGSALLSVCTPQCANGRVLVEKVLSVPQLGIEGTIPIERRLFSDRTVQLEFAPSGELTKAKFIDASGEAAKASAGKESAAPVVSAPQGKKGDTTSKPTTPASPQ